MKKIFVLAALLLGIGSGMVSCKSHEKCPAYSKAGKVVDSKKTA